MGEPIIETHDLTVYYGRHRGIVDVNLTVEKGETFGFLGPNGAGKTTTQRILLDVIRPTSGSATIFGMDSRAEGVRLRERVGYLPGELALYTNMRADQFFEMYEYLRAENGTRGYWRELADRLDLDVSRRIGKFSRGNKQKVGVVAAFMSKPELLILDEPTSGLDPLVQQTVMELVREVKSESRTVFFSSHILPEVQAVCDRVGIIRDGRLVATEKVEDLVEQRLKRLTIRFENMPPAGAFDREGVAETTRTDGSVSLEVTGELPEVMTQAAGFGIRDIETHSVSLEEIFLAYYGEGKGENGDA